MITIYSYDFIMNVDYLHEVRIADRWIDLYSPARCWGINCRQFLKGSVFIHLNDNDAKALTGALFKKIREFLHNKMKTDHFDIEHFKRELMRTINPGAKP